MDETRIYVVLPRVIRTTSGLRVTQPLGRQVAQACHVTNEMRTEHKFHGIYTTIVLSARDLKEIEHIEGLLKKENLKYSVFYDENKDAYGPGDYLTGLCTAPITQSEMEGILDYLPLWPGDDKN